MVIAETTTPMAGRFVARTVPAFTGWVVGPDITVVDIRYGIQVYADMKMLMWEAKVISSCMWAQCLLECVNLEVVSVFWNTKWARAHNLLEVNLRCKLSHGDTSSLTVL